MHLSRHSQSAHRPPVHGGGVCPWQGGSPGALAQTTQEQSFCWQPQGLVGEDPHCGHSLTQWSGQSQEPELAQAQGTTEQALASHVGDSQPPHPQWHGWSSHCCPTLGQRAGQGHWAVPQPHATDVPPHDCTGLELHDNSHTVVLQPSPHPHPISVQFPEEQLDPPGHSGNPQPHPWQPGQFCAPVGHSPRPVPHEGVAGQPPVWRVGGDMPQSPGQPASALHGSTTHCEQPQPPAVAVSIAAASSAAASITDVQGLFITWGLLLTRGVAAHRPLGFTKTCTGRDSSTTSPRAFAARSHRYSRALTWYGFGVQPAVLHSFSGQPGHAGPRSVSSTKKCT
ncbi:MAG: hypothetical protein CO096_08545, partial [Armatimonadetes bacterium CG_4_9_14_3_um_filter_66_14]